MKKINPQNESKLLILDIVQKQRKWSKTTSFWYFKHHFLWNFFVLLILISLIFSFATSFYFSALYTTILVGLFGLSAHFLINKFANRLFKSSHSFEGKKTFSKNDLIWIWSKTFFNLLGITLYGSLGLGIALIVNFTAKMEIFYLIFALSTIILIYSTNVIVIIIYFLSKFEVLFDFSN